jgi:hypothetical protein
VSSSILVGDIRRSKEIINYTYCLRKDDNPRLGEIGHRMVAGVVDDHLICVVLLYFPIVNISCSADAAKGKTRTWYKTSNKIGLALNS